MIIAGIILLWLLLGLLGTIITREQDGSIPLLLAVIFTLAGPIILLVILGAWLMDIEI